jgi:drug/metabolite transporter (DMT)-like permease
VWSQSAGFLLLIGALPFVAGTPRATDFGWGALCGLAGAGAVALLYRGLAIGAMGVVSPITAVLAALLPVAYGVVVRDARPSLLASIGIALALVAVVAISAAPPASRAQARRGLPEAAGAGACFGIFFIFLAQAQDDAGLYPLLGARVASFIVLVLAGLVLRVSLRPARAALGIIVGGGLCDMLANILYVIAVHRGSLAIVAVLTALYPASTVVLAAVVLHERLRALQWMGVALALAGVAAISAGK